VFRQWRNIMSAVRYVPLFIPQWSSTGITYTYTTTVGAQACMQAGGTIPQ